MAYDDTAVLASIAALQTITTGLQTQIDTLAAGSNPFDPTALNASVAALQTTVDALAPQVAADAAALVTLQTTVSDHLTTSTANFAQINARLDALEAV